MNNRVNDTVLDLDGRLVNDIPVRKETFGPEGVTERIAEIWEMVEAGKRLPLNAEFILGTRIRGVRNTGGHDSEDIERMSAAVSGLKNLCGEDKQYADLVSEL
jgi:hypothetical protein